MKIKYLLIFILSLIFIPLSMAQEENNSFAIVELFTSEGCSSCPPADDFLMDLAKQAKESKQKIYTLGFHVNYWDYLGWKDPFAKSEFNERQRMYSQKLKDGTYTPQMIINGKYSLVGNNRPKALKLINQSLTQKPSCDLILSAPILKSMPPKYLLEFNLINPPPEEFLLNIAIIENNLTSIVLKGENAGETLKHTSVVRTFQTLNLNQTSGTVDYPLWEERRLPIVAFVQNKKTAEILCAQELSPK